MSSIPNPHTPPHHQPPKLQIHDFAREFTTNYKNFAKKYLPLKNPPFLYVFIWLLGMTSVIDRLEQSFIKTGEYALTSWATAWPLILIFGLIAGFFNYWIGGALYHLRVWLSGGSKDMLASRNIFLYSNLPLILVTLISTASDCLIYGNDYFTKPTNTTLDLTWLGIYITGITISIILSYKAVVHVQKTKPALSIIFFIILPALFYFLLFGGAALLFTAKHSQGINYNEQAITAMSAGNYTEAEKFFKLALEKMDKDDQMDLVVINSNLADLYEIQGKKELVIKHSTAALEATPPNTAAWYQQKGELELFKNNLISAITSFELALKLDPNNPDVHNDLGLIYLGEIDEEYADYEKALEYNKKASEIHPEDLTFQFNLAINYYALNNYREALNLFGKIEKEHPDYVPAKFYLGMIYYENNDNPKTKKYLNEVHNLDPSFLTKEVKAILSEIST